MLGVRVAAIAFVLAACTDAVEPAREVTGDVTIDASGRSEAFELTIPEQTRSVTIVATGAPGALYALASFRMGDGAEHVGLDESLSLGPAMMASYYDEQIGEMPGSLFQTIRLGTFTHVYPYRPDQAVVPGRASLRIASSAPGAVHLTVLMPQDDGGTTLHVNLVAVSETLTWQQPPTFWPMLQGLFDQAGIQVVIDNAIELRATGLSNITQSTEPQEAPDSMSARLPELVSGMFENTALDVFVVDRLPIGIAGLSLGTPGPPLRGSYYAGVIVANSSNDTQFARVFAHEMSHFLALQHVTNVGSSGMIYADPLDDTVPGMNNLMQNGTVLTPDQSFALTRSALLQPR